MIGRKFNRWTVTGGPFKGAIHGRHWALRCDCGAEKVLRAGAFMTGQSQSCGCLQKEAAAITGRAAKTHGHSPRHFKDWSPAYRTWAALVRRIRDGGKNESSKRYVGVYLDPAWFSFEKFLADMGDKPTHDHSIDRIDNAKGYFKENCRWATAKEQARNRRSNLNFTLNGKTKCLLDWANEFGQPYPRVRKRLSLGWDVERALTTGV